MFVRRRTEKRELTFPLRREKENPKVDQDLEIRAIRSITIAKNWDTSKGIALSKKGNKDSIIIRS